MTQIRKLAEGLDVETATFTADQNTALTAAVVQLSLLSTRLNVAAAMEDNGGLKYTSVWSIVDGIADRGRLGDAEEERMVMAAVEALTLGMFWKVSAMHKASGPNAAALEACIETRTGLVDKLTEFAIGSKSNAREPVKRSVRGLSLLHGSADSVQTGFCSASAHLHALLSGRLTSILGR